MFDSIKKTIFKQADDIILSGQKDVDDFFEQQKTFLNEYHTHIKVNRFKAKYGRIF